MATIGAWNDRLVAASSGSPGNLKLLKLRGCKLSPDGARKISVELMRNPALLGLDLQGSCIQGTGVAQIAVALGSNPLYTADYNTTLTSLNLQSCQAYSAGATHVANMIKHNNTLRSLNLSDNQIGEKGAGAVARVLAASPALKVLNLAKNDLGEEGGALVGEALAYNSTLQELSLALNAIGDGGATAIAQGLSLNRTLASLDLQLNPLSALGVFYVGVAVKSKPLAPLVSDSRLKVVGLQAHSATLAELPRILASSHLALVLSMKTVPLPAHLLLPRVDLVDRPRQDEPASG
jgi:Ran GTPase-activating protein (RanGAP) involved in mRNA processing and transport